MEGSPWGATIVRGAKKGCDIHFKSPFACLKHSKFRLAQSSFQMSLFYIKRAPFLFKIENNINIDN